MPASSPARQPVAVRQRGGAGGARLVAGVAIVLGAASAAQAQTLLELYDAAHAYDATFLSARALAESVPYRIEQVEALLRPSASLATSALRVETDPAIGGNYGSNSRSVSLSGRQPLFNRANEATVKQAERSLETARADLESAEQDLILRVSQAYFDVLAAQDTLATTRSRTRRRSASSSPRPSATSRSAPRPSPTRARRRHATTSPPRRRSPPRTSW